tara:strand:- start:750 stop:995 length:246 start_codon:yes stop_codon:yes gene_type:complete
MEKIGPPSVVSVIERSSDVRYTKMVDSASEFAVPRITVVDVVSNTILSLAKTDVISKGANGGAGGGIKGGGIEGGDEGGSW